MRQKRQDDESLDVSASPDLLSLAEAVRSSGRPRALRREGETIAVIVPFFATGARRLAQRNLTPEDSAAFRAAAGTWADVDVDRFLADAYAARDIPEDRPQVDL